MYAAYITIKKWFETHHDLNIEAVLLRQVKFIWYEIGPDEKAKQVFARLNIGKISLTNAELIKALLLNKSNFSSCHKYDDEEIITMYQNEIAMEWDTIEYSLQSRDFWLFLNNIGNERATRIEFIFDLIAQNDLLNCSEESGESYYGDLRTFRYFSYFIEHHDNPTDAIKIIWDNVMDIFMTLKEWFDDIELYHYIGFLICFSNNNGVSHIYKEWKNSSSKSDFRLNYLKKEIKRHLGNKDIELTVYEGYGDGGPKTNCKPILLLHNIQTIINQNTVLASNDKYGQGVFYKFPFHIYKAEQWDIEHIDSNTENALNDIKSQREWLLNSYNAIQNDEDNALRSRVKTFFTTYLGKASEVNSEDKKIDRDKEFEQLRLLIESSGRSKMERLDEKEKNMIWNFVLLDSSTNRSYGNSIFPAKRRVIMGKEQGKWFAPPTLDENGEITETSEKKSSSSFIAPCTKYVFMKYYDTNAFSPNEWNKEDAKHYLEDIKTTLKEFL